MQQPKLTEEGSIKDKKRKIDPKFTQRSGNDLPPIKNTAAYSGEAVRKDTDTSNGAGLQPTIYSSVAKKDFKRLYDSSSISQIKNQTKYSSF